MMKVLSDISFTINYGEFVAIIGPSGSGKSTLMNMIGCLDSASEGSYHLEGVDVSKLSDNKLAKIRSGDWDRLWCKCTDWALYLPNYNGSCLYRNDLFHLLLT